MARAYWKYLTGRFEKAGNKSRCPQVEKEGSGRRRQREHKTRKTARVDMKGWRGERTMNGNSAGTETQRAATARPQEPKTASRQVDEETADVANPHATCAGPTRPAGASRNHSEEGETAEEERGQGAGAEGPGEGAEDKVARGEGAIAVDGRGASGDNEVDRVYA